MVRLQGLHQKGTEWSSELPGCPDRLRRCPKAPAQSPASADLTQQGGEFEPSKSSYKDRSDGFRWIRSSRNSTDRKGCLSLTTNRRECQRGLQPLNRRVLKSDDFCAWAQQRPPSQLDVRRSEEQRGSLWPCYFSQA